MTWLQTGGGRIFDLLEPDPAHVDFEIDIAEALARIPRFCGHVRAGPYSVAQHCVLGADIIFRDSCDRNAAAAFLLHDAHEAYLGDIATPVAWAIAEACAAEVAEFELAPSRFRRAVKRLKGRIDQAVYRAAGIPGLQDVYAEATAAYDLRMLVTERAHLLGRPLRPWDPAVEAAKPLRLTGGLSVWPWPKAADEFRERLRRYLPERFGITPARPRSGPRPAGARRALQTLEA